MAQFFAPVINEQQEDSNGKPLAGGTIEVYLAGTSTPAATTSDQAGAEPNTNPIVLNSLGVNVQGSVWLTGGTSYKFVIRDANGVLQRTIDDVTGINDTTVSPDQWVLFSGPPTYVNATSFTLEGDQTQIFQVGRRVKSSNTGGTVYSTIVDSEYVAPNTTVTVRNTSGSLDSGLSMVSYGLVSTVDGSVPGILLNIQRFTANGTYTPSPGTNFIVVEAVGGGGGGGGCTVTAAGQISIGGGGGSGAYVKSRINSGFSGAAVVVGAAGVGQNGLGGTVGGATTFLTISAGGGGGGNSAAAATAAAVNGGGGGVASGGSLLNVSGNYGATAVGAFSTGVWMSGTGGSGIYGAGAAPVAANTVASSGASGGAAPAGFGGGGGGGASGPSTGVRPGGDGAPGILLIYEYD